jgi:hypothetical protein
MPDKPTTVAVITGEHSFDVPSLYRLFRSLEAIDAYVQHLEQQRVPASPAPGNPLVCLDH